VKTPAIASQKRSNVTDTVQLPQLTVAWLTPPAYTPEAYSNEAAIFALGGAKASRLDEALVYKSQLAQRVTCESMPLKLTGITTCSAIAKPGVKLEDIEAKFWAEVDKLQKEGPTAEEVEAAKAMNLTQKISGLQRLGGFGGVADTLDKYNQYTGDPGFLPKDVAMAEAVSVASTKTSAQKYFTKDSAVVVYCTPGKKVLDDVPRSPEDTDANVKIVNPYSSEFEKAQEWRKQKPAAGPAPEIHLPVPTEFSLDNGLKVLLVEQHSLPVLSAELVSRAGSANVDPAKAGLATLVSEVMSDGTESRNLEKLAGDQERIGTSIAANASMDFDAISMNVLTAHANEGMEILADVAQHPAFRTDDVERRRKQRLVRISQETDNVSSMATRVGPRLLFGDIPYGMSTAGTTESVKALSGDDFSSFYKKHYGPNDSVLVLAGDVGRTEAEALAKKYFGDWKNDAAQPAAVSDASAPQSTHVVIVDKPGAPQTALYAFGVGVPSSQPNMPTLTILNYTLGGSFASRINMNLREVHGYTYGARSGFSAYRDGGMFFSGSLVRTDVTANAAKEMMGEIRNFIDKPATAEELEAAKEGSMRSLPGRFETNTAIAAAIDDIFVNNRPLDYYAKLPARYQAVTQDDVAAAAKQYLHPDQLIIVTAGDRSKIEPTLKDAGLGPLEVRTVNGDLAGDKPATEQK
jgi:zinc protease